MSPHAKRITIKNGLLLGLVFVFWPCSYGPQASAQQINISEVTPTMLISGGRKAPPQAVTGDSNLSGISLAQNTTGGTDILSNFQGADLDRALSDTSAGNEAAVLSNLQSMESIVPLDLIAGRGMVLSFANPVIRVAMADEKIARVHPISADEIIIDGMKLGQTSLLIWFENGQRYNYSVRVRSDLTLLNNILHAIDPLIEVEEGDNGKLIILKGELDDHHLIMEADRQAREVLSALGTGAPKLLNLISQPLSPDVRLRKAMATIDERIEVRRIRVGSEVEGVKDSYVLEGRVKTLKDVVKAIVLAERQLGELGDVVSASDNSKISAHGFSSGISGVGGGGGAPNGLAAQLSRGLILKSASGRVISFLEVDSLYQIMVSIKALEIDRQKARKIGMNYQVAGKHFSVGSKNAPGGSRGGSSGSFGGNIDGVRRVLPQIIDMQSGNFVGQYVSSSIDILSAVDFLQERDVGRSVAEPNVLTLSGEQASVSVGGTAPIPTSTLGQSTTFTGFRFQSFGVQLNIRPTYDEDTGIITMEVAPSISRPDQNIAVDNVPGFQVQSVQTTARVKNGESLILGGLISFREGMVERKFPILGNIPLINHAFKWKGESRDEQELLFVITPRVIRKSEEGIEEPVQLPPLLSRDTKINDRKVVPQTSTEDGRADGWQSKSELLKKLQLTSAEETQRYIRQVKKDLARRKEMLRDNVEEMEGETIGLNKAVPRDEKPKTLVAPHSASSTSSDLVPDNTEQETDSTSELYRETEAILDMIRKTESEIDSTMQELKAYSEKQEPSAPGKKRTLWDIISGNSSN